MTPEPAPFAARVVNWQAKYGRHDLPWQETRDPYRIWVSEIMLQQTQVAAVVPYYRRFIDRFGDVRALAGAPLADVLAAWSGLGYYSRARNLHRCAQAIVERHGGEFPRTSSALADLPGIGRSTAAAIAAFAFGERGAILDGNVKRVLARHFGFAAVAGTAPAERALWQLAESVLPTEGIERYTQGMMDLGATVCARRRPLCEGCPVAASCVALAQGRTAELPLVRRAKPRPVRELTALLVRDDAGAWLVESRPPTGVWGGLLSVPEFDAGASDAELVRAAAERFGLDVELHETLGVVQHDFTHFRLRMHPRLASVRRALGVSARGCRFIGRDALPDVGLPAPIRRLLGELPEQFVLS